MATIRKRGNYQWQAMIRRKGFPAISKTFETRADAEDWAREEERSMRRGTYIDRRAAQATTLLEMLKKYEEEVTPRKKGQDRELARLKKWKEHKISNCTLAGVQAKDISAYRDARRNAGKAENTIRLEIALLSSVFEHCKKDWGIEVENPCRKIKLPGGSKKRERRLSPGEEAALLEFITKAMPRSKHLPELIELDIETGMRQSEMLGIEWENVFLDEKRIHLDETKSGDPRDVPLSPRAIVILEGLAGKGEKVLPIRKGKIFNVTQDALVRGFNKACKLAREAAEDPAPGFMADLKFHDLRHEAASRWASALQTHDLCKMFGWKTIQMAMRYYHPTAGSIAEKLARAKPS